MLKVVIVVGTEEIFFTRDTLRILNTDTGQLAVLDPDLDDKDRTIAVFNKWDYWFYISRDK